VDTGRCAQLESRRQKEDASIKHCPIPKANRGSYSAKGIQPWSVPRFSSLMLGLFGSQELSPAEVRGFSFSLRRRPTPPIQPLWIAPFPASRPKSMSLRSEPSLDSLDKMIRAGASDGRHAPLYRTRPAMLDGKRYYEAFPDEKPTLSSLHALLRTLEKLEGEFRKYVEQSGEGDAPEIGPDGPRQGSARRAG
jgi:hypothetical protein